MAKKKLKKLLKNVAKVGGAVMLGKALMGKKGTGLTDGKFLFSPAAGGARYKNPRARALKAMTSNAAYSDDTMPGNLSKNMGMFGRDSVLAKPGINRMTDYYGSGLKKGGTVVKTGEKVAKRKKKIGIQIKGFGKARTR